MAAEAGHGHAVADADPQVRPYRVSTITAVGNVCSSIDLALLHSLVPLAHADGFLSAKLDGVLRVCELPVDVEAEASVVAAKGPARVRARVCKDGKGGTQGRTNAGSFGNQVTLVLAMEGTRVNLKAFRNGRVQLTGVKEVGQGLRAIERLVDELRALGGAVAESPLELRAADYRVCLINSDLDVGFPVRRDLLLRCLRETYAGTACSYEPCIYPGLKIKYMCNAGPKPSTSAGACGCSGGPCGGKGDGLGDGRCRKVTVAVFQSGKVIITGAQTFGQVDAARRFLVDEVAALHAERFRMPLPAPVPVPVSVSTPSPEKSSKRPVAVAAKGGVKGAKGKASVADVADASPRLDKHKLGYEVAASSLADSLKALLVLTV